jgi:polyhydroxyalkanoate synthesis regulator phasin
MAARKRASTQSKLLNRAVKAGRSALRQAQRSLPPDVRKQIDKTVKEGQKTIHIAIKQVETRLDRTARQADLEKAMKRLDQLSKQMRNLAMAAAESASSRTAGARPAARKTATRKTAARKPATRTPAPRKPTTRKAATGKAAPARRTTRRTTRRAGGSASTSPTSGSNGGQPGSNGS